MLADKLLGNFQIKCIWGEGALSFNSIYIFKIKMTAQVLQLSPELFAAPACCCEKPLLGTLVRTKGFFRRDAGLALSHAELTVF